MSNRRFSRVWTHSLAVLLLSGTTGILVASPAEGAHPGVTGRIFFQSDRDGNPDLYSMNGDGSRLARLTTNGANTSPALSPDGTRLAYVHDGDVWTMDIDGTRQEQVTDTPAAELTPTWSPDATRIAYVVRAEDGADLEIMVRASDGTGNATHVTDNTYPDTDPAWSPPLPGRPGGLLAFVSARPGDTDRNVYVTDPAGGDASNLTYSRSYGGVIYQGHDDSPSWSPDGKIAFTHTFQPNAGGLLAIWTVAPDGSGLARLSTDPAVSASEPAWSPDGQQVAFVAANGTDRNISVMDADGTGGMQVDTAVSHDIAPDWQEDSVDPHTTVTAGAQGETTSTSATVQFAANEPGSTFECSLDAQPFLVCTSPRTWTGLAVGAHSVRVRAVDPVGRRDPSPAARTWSVVGPPVVAAQVAATVRLDRTHGRVPATLALSSAGARLDAVVRARILGKWVRIGRVRVGTPGAGTLKLRVPVRNRWRQSLEDARVKALLEVVVTSPAGATGSTTERFWLRG